MKNLKGNKAITLVALIITIIILLILAGISISNLLGEDGLINKAKQAREKYQNAEEEEYSMLNEINKRLDLFVGDKPSSDTTSYNIVYNLDGGSLQTGETNLTTYSEDTETFTLKNPTKENDIFKGWTGSNGTTPQKTVTIKKGTIGNLTYTANWGAYALIPQMTSNTEPSGEASGSSGDSGDSGTRPYYAFDGNTSTCYSLGGVGNSESALSGWMQYKFDQKVVVLKMDLTPRFFAQNGPQGLSNFPETITLSGSNDNITFTTIQTYTVSNQPTSVDPISFSVDNDNNYLYYRINGTAFDDRLSLSEIQLYGFVGDLSSNNTSYSITYDLDGGSLQTGETNPTTYSMNTETFTLKNPTKENVIFKGWTGSNGTTPQKNVTINKGTAGNLTYTANWGWNELIPQMTSNTAPSGEASGSSGDSGDSGTRPYYAFDGNTNTCYSLGGSGNSESALSGWMQYKFDQKVVVRKMELTPRYLGQNVSQGLSNFPQTITLSGSNDNITFTTIQTYTVSNQPTSIDPISFNVTNDNNYLYYRISGTAFDDRLSLSEIQLYGFVKND